MNHIFIKDGMVKQLSKREARRLHGKPVLEVIENMTQEKLERFNLD